MSFFSLILFTIRNADTSQLQPPVSVGNFDVPASSGGGLTPSEVLADIISGLAYVNVHSVSVPAGEVRGTSPLLATIPPLKIIHDISGQIEMVETWTFSGTGDGDQERPPVDTNAVLSYNLTVDTKCGEFTWDIDQNATDVTVVHFHNEIGRIILQNGP